MHKVCIVCQSRFEDNSPNKMRKWCTHECKLTTKRSTARQTPHMVDKLCKQCNSAFTDVTLHKRQLFCKLSCLNKSRNKNPEKIIKKCKQCGFHFPDTTKGKNKVFCGKRCKSSNLEFRVKHSLRSRLNHALKNDQKTGSAVNDLGCSIAEFKVHIESLFQPGMAWSNYGRRGWHIDHIKPLARFKLSDSEELKKACHYTNLQPLWAKDNLSKGIKYGD